MATTQISQTEKKAAASMNFTEGKIKKKIIAFTVPMLVSGLLIQTYSATDSIIVGRYLGTEALSAVGSCEPIIYAVVSLIIGIGSLSSAIISQYFGSKDYNKVKIAADTTLIFFILASVLIAVIGFFFSEYFLRVMNIQDPKIFESASSYLTIYLAGCIGLFGYYSIASILRGIGDTRTPIIFLLISAIINIGLDFLFVAYLKYGVTSVAYATIISQIISFIFAIIYLRRHSILRLNILKLHFSYNILVKTVTIGFSSGLSQMMVALSMISILSLVNSRGLEIGVGFIAANKIESFIILPLMSFAATLSTYVAQNIGAMKQHRIDSGFFYIMKISLLTMLTLSILIQVFKTPLMRLFTNNDLAIESGSNYLGSSSAFYVVIMLMLIYQGALRGAGKTLYPMFATLFALWIIRVPIAYSLSNYVGEFGIWFAIPISWIMGFLGSFIYYKRTSWRYKSMIS